VKIRLAHKIVFIATLSALSGMSFILIIQSLVDQEERISRYERDVRTTSYQLEQAIVGLMRRGFLLLVYSDKGDPGTLAKLRENPDNIPQLIDATKHIYKGRPDELLILEKLDRACRLFISSEKETIKLIDMGGPHFAPMRATELQSRLRSLAFQVSDSIAQLRLHTKDDLKENPVILQDIQQNIDRFLLAGIAGAFILSIGLAVLLSREIGGRLRIVAENNNRLLRQESPVKAGGTDEIADLDRVFREMAYALLEATHKEKAAIANAIDVICSLDRQNRFVSVSPASETVWGFAPQELIGRNIMEITDVENSDHSKLMLNKISNDGSAQSFENRVVRKDGRLSDMLWSAHWSEPDNSMFCIAHDISERKHAENMLKESEARVRLMMERIPAALVVLDENGCVLLSNARTEQMFGYSGSELAGKPVSRLFQEDGREEDDLQSLMQTLKQNAMGKVVPMEARKQDGERCHVELSLDAFENAGTAGFLLIMLDMTKIYQVQKLKQRLIAMIAHDIATPLASINATLEMLIVGIMGTLSERAERKIRLAEQESRRLVRLFQDLLRIEKYDSQDMTLKMAPVSLCTIARQSMGSVQVHADEKGIALVDCCNEDIELTADADRLTQLLVNLLSNAIKFSPANSKITLSIKTSADFVELQVSDQGRGIPPGMEETIFEPLKQVYEADAKEQGGFGLGLAICKSIVQRHGGTIGARNNETGGATFWIRLPVINALSPSAS